MTYINMKIVIFFYILRLAYLDFKYGKLGTIDLIILFTTSSHYITALQPKLMLALAILALLIFNSYILKAIGLVFLNASDVMLAIILYNNLHLHLIIDHDHAPSYISALGLSTFLLLSWNKGKRIPYFFVLSPLMLYLALAA